MTTIAYHHKDKQIAVDGRCTANNVILTEEAIKIHECKGVTFVMCGKVTEIEIFIEKYPDIDQKLSCYGIMIDDGVVYDASVDEKGKFSRCKLYYNDAFGSGCEFAIAAMDFGKNAKEAVEYTMTRDSGTGGKVTVIDL